MHENLGLPLKPVLSKHATLLGKRYFNVTAEHFASKKAHYNEHCRVLKCSLRRKGKEKAKTKVKAKMQNQKVSANPSKR